MAAPHVAGVAALMQSARVASGQPPLTPLEFDSLLQDGRLTKDLGSKGRDDQFGYGLIKADKAVQAALTINVEPPPPSLAVTPDILNFRTDFTAASVIMSNAGGGELQVETVTELPADAGWLRIDAPESDDGLGTYIFRVSRSDLADGDYSATVRLQSSANTVDIEVAMTVSSARKRTDVGDIYVRLYEAEEILFTGNQIGVTSRDGSFRFDDVPGGCYIVAAGTNLDGDSFIGDIGEAWSGYPSKVEFDPILLDANANAIDFEIAFDQAELIPSSSEPK